MTGRPLAILIALLFLMVPMGITLDPEVVNTDSSRAPHEGYPDAGAPAPDERIPDHSAPQGEIPVPVRAHTRAPPPYNPPWWNQSWLSRQKLTFNNSAQAEDLVNFPVLVNLSGLNFNYSRANPDGSDLRFIDADNVTQLKYHIEVWNSSGYSHIWVNVTGIDANSSMDHIWMYYGNPGASEKQDVMGTYDDYFVGVWHLNETKGYSQDSTKNGNNGVTQGGVDRNMSGNIGGGCGFDGVDDLIDCGNTPSLDITGEITIESWVKVADPEQTGVMKIVSKKATWNSNDGYELEYAASTNILTILSSGINIGKALNVDLDSNWHHLAAVINGTIAALYCDGVEVTTDSFVDALASGAENVEFGRQSGNAEWFNGGIDELRISRKARSGDWNKAQYLSMCNSFITYKSEELAPVPQVISTIDDFSIVEDSIDRSIDLYSVFHDEDTPILNFSCAHPGKVSVEIAPNGSVTLTPAPDWSGVEPISFNAWDESGSASEGFTLSVFPEDDPPFLVPINDTVATQNKPFQLFACGDDDRDGGTVSYYDNSTLFDIDAATGEIAFTPHNPDVGVHHTTVWVTDVNKSTANTNFTIQVKNVNDAPRVETIDSNEAFGNLTGVGPGSASSPVLLDAVEDNWYNFTVTASDIDQDELGLNENLTFLYNLTGKNNIQLDPITGNVSFLPNQADVDDNGGHLYCRVTVRDSGGLEGAAYMDIRTINVNDPPTRPDFTWMVIMADTNATSEEGVNVKFTGTPSFDEDGDELTYSWRFGEDGAEADDGDLVTTHLFTEFGEHLVTLNVSDGHGGTAQRTRGVYLIKGIPQENDTTGNGPDVWDFDEKINTTDDGQKDTDGDGIPDEWELEHGLDPRDPSDADADPDGDGITNLEEYLGVAGPSDPDEEPGGTDGGDVPEDPADTDGGDGSGGDGDADDDGTDAPGAAADTGSVADNTSLTWLLWIILILTVTLVMAFMVTRARRRRRAMERSWDEREDGLAQDRLKEYNSKILVWNVTPEGIRCEGVYGKPDARLPAPLTVEVLKQPAPRAARVELGVPESTRLPRALALPAVMVLPLHITDDDGVVEVQALTD